MRRDSENRTAMPMLSIQPQPRKDDCESLEQQKVAIECRVSLPSNNE